MRSCGCKHFLKDRLKRKDQNILRCISFRKAFHECMDVVGFKQLILMSSLDGSVKMSDGLANLLFCSPAKTFHQ